MANHASVAIFVVSAVSFFLVLVESTAKAQLQQRQTSVTSALPAPADGTFQEMEGRKFNFNYPWHHKQQAEVSSNSVDSDAEARFFGNVVDSYLKFAQKFDTSNPFRKIQKYGLSNFLAYRAATMNRAFNSAWYRAKSYYYAAQSGATSLLGSLPESTRERLFSRLVQDGIPYVMNATGVFAPSAVEWAVDTGNKMLDVYKRERQAERRHAMAAKHGVEGVTSTEASERYRQARHMERRPRRRLHNMDMKNPGRSDNYKEDSTK